MKTFKQFQEQIKTGGTIKKPTVIMPDGKELPGLGGGGGGTDSITDKSPAKSFKKRVKDVGKILTFPFHKRRKDPTEKFATEEALIAGKDRLDPEVLKKYPDLDPTKARDYSKLKRLQKKLSPKIDLVMKTEEVVAPTNNVGDGKIAGTVEAGDDPPVKKKKKGKGKTYAYGGVGSRRNWMV